MTKTLQTCLCAVLLGMSGILPSSSSSSSLTPPVDDSYSSESPHPPRRVIEVGLPRMGSNVLYEYFRCLLLQHQPKQPADPTNSSIVVLHCCCDATVSQFPCPTHKTIGETLHRNALNSEAFLVHSCPATIYTGLFVETSDPYGYFLPQHFALPLLHDDVANDADKMVWILPHRESPERWARSVLHWHSVTQRLLESFGYSTHTDTGQSKIRVAPAHDQSLSRVTHGLQTSIEQAYSLQYWQEQKQHVMDIYTHHIQTVQSYAQKHSIPLIEINIDQDPQSIVTQLQHALPEYHHSYDSTTTSTSSTESSCWSIEAVQALDDDWRKI